MTTSPLIRALDRSSIAVLVILGLIAVLVPLLNLALPPTSAFQIPTYLVSAMTRKHVTVALSGDGGDELFAGYNRYQLTQRFWRSLSLMPQPLRKGAAAALTAVRPDRWTQLLSVLPRRLRPPQAGDKVHKAASVLRLGSADAVYRRLVSHWEPS